MYVKHCKLPRNNQLEFMKYFVAGSTARTAAELAGVHRNAAVRFFISYAPPLLGNNRKELHSLLEREN
ncbi:MAG: hypothetical protein HRT36_02540 [Alphaproteobacteria bacterium]|nr:hypothetical protein [Alphaproteobacteria bacterium]